MPNRLWLNINFRHARLSTGDGAKPKTMSFADTPKIQHYNTLPPFDAEDIMINTNVTVESVDKGLAKVTTPCKTAVVPTEGPREDIEVQEQGLFIDLMKNLIYLSSAKVCGKPGQVVRSCRP